MTANENIVDLPRHFVGNDDESKLESFAAHLISHGLATRWHWSRQRGIAVELSIYAGSGASEELLVRIARDSGRDTYYATDRRGIKMFEGELEVLMTVIDHAARTTNADAPA